MKKTNNSERVVNRLQGFDYTDKGLYFITVCVDKHSCIFGNIHNGKMHLNNMRTIAYDCWTNIPLFNKGVLLHDYVIMPNHIHGILEKTIKTDKHIGKIVASFKAAATRSIRENHPTFLPPTRSLWHRNYYDHIIRNETDYHRIAHYIQNNPNQWQKDRFYK